MLYGENMLTLSLKRRICLYWMKHQCIEFFKSKKSLELSDTKVMMILGGLTRYLKPLDASIKKPFKDGIRKKYNKI